MSKHMPPVPPGQQTPYGGPDHAQDLGHQGQQGNIRQNASHQGNHP